MKKPTIPPVSYAGSLPLELRNLVHVVDGEAIAYGGRSTDVLLLERYLAGGDHRTATSLAAKMVLFQRQYRQMQSDGLPAWLQSLVDQVHSDAFEYEGRETDLYLLKKYTEGGDFNTLAYQAKLIIERQANMCARMATAG